MGTGGFNLTGAWFISEERFSVFLYRCVPLCSLLHYLNGLKNTGLFIHQKTHLLFVLLGTKYTKL